MSKWDTEILPILLQVRVPLFLHRHRSRYSLDASFKNYTNHHAQLAVNQHQAWGLLTLPHFLLQQLTTSPPPPQSLVFWLSLPTVPLVLLDTVEAIGSIFDCAKEASAHFFILQHFVHSGVAVHLLKQHGTVLVQQIVVKWLDIFSLNLAGDKRL